MHIGLYTECLTNPPTGVESMALTLIEELKKTPHTITCFHTNHHQHPQIQGVNNFLFRKPLPLPFYHRFAALFHTKCFDSVDVLHIQHPQLPYFKKPLPPVIMTVHDVLPLLLPHFFPAKMTRYYRHVLPLYLKKVDAIHAISDTTKTDIMRHYNIPSEKINVIYPSLSYQNTITHSEKKDIILYVGTLEPRKNVATLIKAFAILKKRGLPHTLVIVGKKSWSSRALFDLIRQLHLSDHVAYKGFISDKEKNDLYQEAAIFVYPSYNEGFGLPVIEAMAHGTPVIASDTPIFREVVGDAGVLVDPHDPQALAHAISTILRDSQSKKLSKLGQKRAHVFSRESLLKNTLALYEELIAR